MISKFFLRDLLYFIVLFVLGPLFTALLILGLGLVVINNMPGPESKRTRVKADFASIRVALRMYRLDNGHYPCCLVQLLEERNGNGPWMEGSDFKDPWGNSFAYKLVNSNNFILVSFGADGRVGGEWPEEDIVLRCGLKNEESFEKALKESGAILKIDRSE